MQKYIIQATDINGCSVLLGEQEWKNHILVKHPEIESFLEEIKKAVKSPTEVHLDPEDARVYLYYHKLSQKKRPHKKIKYLLVVIKYVNAPEEIMKRLGLLVQFIFYKILKKEVRNYDKFYRI